MIKDLSQLLAGTAIGLFGLAAIGLGLNYVFGVPTANVERRNYEQTASYIQGKNNTIAQWRVKYRTATDPGQKAAIAAYVQQEMGGFDGKNLTSENFQFVSSLEQK
jgi:hypothetical protein